MKLSFSIKIFLVGILFLLMPFSSILKINVEAVPRTVVKVEPQINFARVGETFTVNVTVHNVQNLYGVEVVLNWNPSVLEIINVDVRLGEPDGVLYQPLSSPYKNETSQEQGAYVFACSSVSPAPSFNGTGSIVKLAFNVINVGRSKLSLGTKLASNLMTPSGVAEIVHETEHGFYYPIQIRTFPRTITLHENISVSGFIAIVQPNVPVTILGRHQEETEWNILNITTTDEQGSYLYTWTPEKSGKYYVKSTATILGIKGTSSVISVEVTKPEEPVWLYVSTFIAGVTIVIVILLISFVHHKRTQKRRKTA